MTKDYAYSQPKKKVASQLLIWWTMILCIPAIALILLVLHHHSKPHQTITTPVKIIKKHTKIAPNTKALNATKSPATSFDFYSMLAQNQQTIKPEVTLLQPNQYYLQAAVTTSQPGAVKLASRLGTEGYPTTIKNINNQHIKRYLVLIGPYTTTAQAALDQTQLKTLNTQTLVVNSNNLPH